MWLVEAYDTPAMELLICECLPAFMPQVGILEVVAELCGCGSDRSVIHGSPLVDLCKDVAMKNMFVLYQVERKRPLGWHFCQASRL